MRDRASYAFALVSVAAALELDEDGTSGTCGWRWAASRTSRGARCEGRGRAAGRPATADSFRAAAEAELADARPLRDNAFKIELARRTIAAVLAELAGDAA